MKRYTPSLLSEMTGLPLASASLEVLLAGTSTRAVLYANDDLGGPTVPNPAPNGAPFFVPDGRYDLKGRSAGRSNNVPDVDLFDLFEQNRRLEACENGEAGALGSLRSDLADPLQAPGLIATAPDWTLGQKDADLPYDAMQKVPLAMRAAIIDGTSALDVAAHINAAITAAKIAGYRTVRLSRGRWNVGALIDSQGIDLVGDGRSTVLRTIGAIATVPAVPGGAHQGQTVWLRAGSSLRDVLIDQNLYSGGVVASAASDVGCERVRVENGPINGIGLHAFHFLNCTRWRLHQCSAYKVSFQTQIWTCTDGVVSHSFFERGHCGVFEAGCRRFLAVGNVILDMEDVGLDAEGGEGILFLGNYASRCANGEASLFEDASGAGIGNHDCVFASNILRRQASYTHRDGTVKPCSPSAGAMMVASLSPGARGIAYTGNQVTVQVGWAFFTNVWNGPDQGLVVMGNAIHLFAGAGGVLVTSGAGGLQYLNNHHQIDGVGGTRFTFKNMRGGAVLDNVFRCTAVPSDYLVLLYSDQASMQACEFFGNKFFGAEGKAVKHDSFVSGFGTFRLGANDLSEHAVPAGGLLCTNNGVPQYAGLKLLVAEASTGASAAVDFDAFSFVGTTTQTRPMIAWKYYLNRGQPVNAYQGLYISGGVRSLFGSGPSSGLSTNPNEYATFTGSTMTVTKTSSPNTSVLELELTSQA